MTIDPKLVDRLVELVKNVKTGYADIDIECHDINNTNWFDERDAVLEIVRKDLESR